VIEFEESHTPISARYTVIQYKFLKMLSSSTIDENDCRRVSEPLTLFTRGKKHKVNGILSSAYNPVKRELLLATSSCLLLFGNFFDFGGEVY
jgi:hypothetical protein